MDAVLPGFITSLLAQSRDPSDVPDIAVSAARDWHAPLAARVLQLLNTQTPMPGAFLAHGYAHLPLPVPDPLTAYLRVSDTRAMTAWSASAPAALLTLAGVTHLEMYRKADEMCGGHPQYARAFGPGEFFAVHPGTLCATTGSETTVQLLATTGPAAVPGAALAGVTCAAFTQRARRRLEQVALTPVGGPC
ncbi:hypothetical protein [Streptomyces sp. NPDC059168]|uniref:hypothetical protein n=1 Tax=Streptomyces sp. NPDC059168 TaxID=3346753 RepID=UPI00368686D1